jgi:hypothetical protein
VTPGYYCEYCGAQIIRHERALCLSRHKIFRRPVRWTAEEDQFSNGDHEAMFHEKCLVGHASEILEELLDGTTLQEPRRRPVNPR